MAEGRGWDPKGVRLRIYRWWWVKVVSWPVHRFWRNTFCPGWIPRRHVVHSALDEDGTYWVCDRCREEWFRDEHPPGWSKVA